MTAQRRFAHFPSLFVEHDDRALVIGLGTGTTLGTIAAYPWKRIDVAEISPAIVEASRRYFAGPSLGALDDPRVHLDAQRRPQRAPRRRPSPTISSPSSSPACGSPAPRASTAASSTSWCARASPRAASSSSGCSSTTSGGASSPTIVHTLRGVFPHVALFVGGAQGILVAERRAARGLARRASTSSKQRPDAPRDARRQALARLLDELVASEGRARSLRRRDAEASRDRRLDRRQPLPRVRDAQGQRAQLRRFAGATTLVDARALSHTEVRGHHLGP